MRAYLWEYAWLVIFPRTFTLDKIVKLDLHFLIKDIYRYPNLLASVHPPRLLDVEPQPSGKLSLMRLSQ